MPASCSLVVVNYRSASLAIDAVRSARAATQNPIQVVVFDNSVDPREADALQSHADVLMAADTNLGYGAAINRARSKCDGNVLLVCNPDIRLGPQSIDTLLDSDADVTGPALFWDDRFEWFLPPSELHTATQAFDAAMASRSIRWRRSRDRHRIQQRIAFWSLRSPTRVPAISGAVMAIRRAAFDRVGGFDERFHLYFEEIDFQRRLQTGSILYMPDARCRHLYNQSAGKSATAADAFARSEMQYLEKWSGKHIANWIKRIETPVTPPAVERLTDGITLERRDVVIEASPLASFETAAGHFPGASTVDVPAEVWKSYLGEALYLRIVERDSARVLGSFVKIRIPA
ncbi:MAG TPA: glycosyltransferase [Thermoanaerobaculia bacterium]|nr:glycosyltransferase [Thermoanaerobaculia bacterium]